MRAIGFLIAALVLVAAPASAGRLVVDPSGQGDYTTVTAAVAASVDGDTIAIVPETYDERVTIHKTLTLLGIDDGVTLSGGHSHRILDIGGAHTVRLIDLEFRDGSDPSVAGAVFCNSGTQLVVDDCRFRNNSSGWDSGALRLGGSGTHGWFSGCTFDGNFAEMGGAACQVQFDASATFENCVFRGNLTNTIGGGLTVWQSDVEVVRCLFVGNQAHGAGAIHLEDATCQIRSCTFHGNRSQDNATITLLNGSTLWIKNCILSGDLAGAGLSLAGDNYCEHTCNLYHDNYTGPIQYGGLSPDEIVSDPLFANVDSGDYRLLPDSPGLPGNNSCGALIGAFGSLDILSMLSVTDVAADEGGFVSVAWSAGSLENGEGGAPVDVYRVERFDGAWITVETVAPAGLDEYAAVVPCPTVVGEGGTVPGILYRVEALLTDGTSYATASASCFSVDNLAPETSLATYEHDEYFFVCWESAATDLDHVELFRSTDPAVFPDEPLEVLSDVPCHYDTNPIAWYYRARGVDIHGNVGPFSAIVHPDLTAAPDAVPPRFEIAPNVPNPFNPSTRILFSTATAGPVTVAIHDLTGALIALLARTTYDAGDHALSWNGKDERGEAAPAGIYFVRIESPDGARTRKIALIR